MERNYETFRHMLQGAICNRTQAQFAIESGISAEHLSRMLNMETICRPTRKTLEKIAAAAKHGIILQDLINALDSDDKTKNHPSPAREKQAAEDFAPEFKDLAENTMKALCKILASQKYPLFVESLTQHINSLITNIGSTTGTLPVAYETGQDRENHGCYCNHAQRYMPVWLSMADQKNIAESTMMVYFNEIQCSGQTTHYVIHDVTCATRAIHDPYGAFCPEPLAPENKDDTKNQTE